MIDAFVAWLAITPSQLLLGVIAVAIGFIFIQVFIDEFL